MNEQFTPDSLKALCCNWQKLKASLYDCDEIRTEFFLETFKNTAECLRPCLTADAISKEYIPLITDAYAFVDVNVGDNVLMQAAQILTERMLYQYVVNTAASEQDADCVAVYLLNNKRQLNIDFSNENVAFSLIAEALRS